MIAPSATTTVRRYLNLKGAASYLSMTEGAVYAAVARRQIPFRRLGRKLVFDTTELDTYMHQLEGVDVNEAVARRLHNGTVKDFSN